MCGRFTYLYKWKQLHRLMKLLEWPPNELVPRFNVAPAQQAPVARMNEGGGRVGAMMRWGLIPPWSNDPIKEPMLNNARGDAVFTKPTFRDAAKKRRCLVPVSGFYEWQEREGEKRKQPYWIGRADREPFCFAGLWEVWRDRANPDASPLESFTIITTEPNALVAPIHDRMPVIVAPQNWETWLNPATQQTVVQGLIHPYTGEDLETFPVSKTVNSTERDDAGLAEKVDLPPTLPGLFG